jgi:hypothetical protein
LPSPGKKSADAHGLKTIMGPRQNLNLGPLETKTIMGNLL